MRTGNRASAVIIKDGQILLIHRKKDGHEYWVFPGGGVEDYETPEETMVREIKEETNQTILSFKPLFNEAFEVNGNGLRHNYFYSCQIDGAELLLTGEEASKQSEHDWYNPEWVELSEFPALEVLPERAKDKILAILKQ
ncbi:MAG: Phosphohydrolase, MutT/nudix family protein [Candidatus Amesbacteria bacterium GW2011_GWA2_47_11b]|uniref:Phosphohydrolase, MutT/nudix family protein n=3 Tax=Candidatus Amesiibacteriota TaxID=1752730 RepID=A0A0G1SL41_9BACT|nr:MAG: Phosphohydrolase, MutT/nudix family protein [Microgenomates group bacterium GW2011_GWC1_46_20]KKU58575.1 MAG: Phosphohydrolase, MutT/nudix family protein [Candidatus Amesbacteria bacterium GW2011_GWA2_47_11b]KKU70152.1 MAG: Phosphohydrolase, MutT/nudix family protein [Candidatus Amesbacteria bacterium GW2011_GWA1_47_20]KKU84667.1 MAG: Phosphohydrolase, MutT/nudix family protein [Candidatus Amesbacteria bacterium GW2011_GWC2_47_8]